MKSSRKFKELNAEPLRQMYIDDNMTATAIAEKIGCSRAAVLNAAKYYGLQKRKNKAAYTKTETARQIPDETLRELYVKQHKTVEEVHHIIHGEDDTPLNKNNPFKFLDVKPSKIIMQELYNNCRNADELADRLGICHKTALNWMREYDIEIIQQKRLTLSQLQEVVETKMSLGEISKKYNCSENLILQYAEKHGLFVRVRKK